MLSEGSDEYFDKQDWNSDEDSEQYSDGTNWYKTNKRKEPINVSLRTKKSIENDSSSGDSQNANDETHDDCASENSTNSDISYHDGDTDDYGSDKNVKQFRTKISKLLDSGFEDQSRGDFAGSGSLPYAPNPGIVIEDLGSVRLPLDKREAEEIISQSEQAPFGKKDNTVEDLSVCKTWRFDGSKVKFENPRWVTFMNEQIIPKAAEKLGLDSRQISANLYKLILYGDGGHLEEHQGTEIEPGMFGNLIIALPSSFTGGTVSASHGSREIVFDTSSCSKYDTYYTCMYSDVFHKVHPITSGFRLVLSYNLIFNIQSELRPKVPLVNPSTEEVRSLLKDWSTQLDAGKDLPRFIMHILDHKYSRVGLDFANIKGKDRAKVDFLKNIADELGLEIYLAQIDITVEGHHKDAEPTGSLDYDCSINEVISVSYELKDAVDPEGKEIDLSMMTITQYDTIPRMQFLQVRADSKEHGDFTDNRGCEVTLYYYRTTLVIWPKNQKLFMNIRTSGLKFTMANLKERFTRYMTDVENGTDSIADRDELLTFSRTVISAFLRPSLSLKSEISRCVKTLKRVAVIVNAPDVFIETMVRSQPGGHELRISDWVIAIKTFGFAPIQDALEVALNEDYTDMDSDDSLWRCDFISDLLHSVPDDKNLETWSEKQWQPQLQKVIIFDDKALDYTVSFSQRNGFQRCEEMLTGFLRNMEKAQMQEATHSEIPNTPCRFIVKIFGRFVQDENTSKWCRDHLIRLVGALGGKADQRDIKSIVDFIRLCLNDPSRQTYVSPILESFQRSTYESSYFNNVICKLVEYMKEELYRNSLTWSKVPYISFASHVFMAGTTIHQRQTPSLPDNYTLPRDSKCNPHMNEFLCSSIRHVLVIRKSNGALQEVDRVVKRFKDMLSYSTPEGDYKHCIIIRKLELAGRSLSDSNIKLLLDAIQSRPQKILDEWTEALCYQKDTCDCCKKIQNCMDWVREQRIYARFCEAFGEDLEAIQKRVKTMELSSQAAPADNVVGGSTSAI